ncbi:MAG: PEGA domain-containing protein [Methanoregulaceae archaeon]|nr:PEGA domain-containing protein [Methanoregulaceae archaeon]
MRLWIKVILCIFCGLLVFSGIATAESSYLGFFRSSLTSSPTSSYMSLFFKSQTEAVQPGSLYIQSTPSGAQVFVGNTNYGTTPVTVSGLKPGFYQVQLTHTGYMSWTSYVTVRSGVPGNVQATLIPMPAQVIPLPTAPTPTENTSATDTTSSTYGSLIIRSEPDGASISIRSNFFDPSDPLLDGKWHDHVGKTPAYWMNAVPPGSYTIALNRGGDGSWCTTVTVIAGQTTEINGMPMCPFCGC